MKIYQRGRVWYLTFYVRGKRVQESTGTSDRRKAEKFCALRLSEVERGEYTQSAKITLAQFGQQYMDYAKANKRSWLRDEQIMTHLNSVFGHDAAWEHRRITDRAIQAGSAEPIGQSGDGQS